jgi:hypothetical protein
MIDEHAEFPGHLTAAGAVDVEHAARLAFFSNTTLRAPDLMSASTNCWNT